MKSARAAGLRYVNAHEHGLTRKGAGQRTVYHDSAGRRVSDATRLGWIKRLAIPPAWTEVWICRDQHGHIQATGRDARSRKQYRYHDDWRTVRDESKYERMLAFGRALPRIRRRVARDLKRPGLGREKVLATMIRLLETTLVRVGNEEYARANGSVGLSTMQDRHVRVRGGTMRFQFRGKSGRHHRLELHDPRLARIVRRTQDLPGQELFQYVDDDGRPHDVTSQDVNGYLQETSGRDFSAKDFRTWAGTVLAALTLRQFSTFANQAEGRRNVVRAIAQVAKQLGNTPAVCRKCYIHPVVLHSYLDGATVETILERTEDVLSHGLGKLSGAEGAVLAFLQQQLRRYKALPLRTALRRSLKATRRPRPRNRVA